MQTESIITRLAALCCALGLACFWLSAVPVPADHALSAVLPHCALGAQIGLGAGALLALVGLFVAGWATAREGYELFILATSILGLVVVTLPSWGLSPGAGTAVLAVLFVVALGILSQRFFSPFMALGISLGLAFYGLPMFVAWLAGKSLWVACLPSLLALLGGVSVLIPGGEADAPAPGAVVEASAAA